MDQKTSHLSARCSGTDDARRGPVPICRGPPYHFPFRLVPQKRSRSGSLALVSDEGTRDGAVNSETRADQPFWLRARAPIENDLENR